MKTIERIKKNAEVFTPDSLVNEMLDKLPKTVWEGCLLDYGELEMKFDVIVMNPPYLSEKHLAFFEKGIELVSDDGMLICVHPSTWLISSKDLNRCKKSYTTIKKNIENYWKRFELFNGNNMFGIGSYMPLSISFIKKGIGTKKTIVANTINGRNDEYDNIWLVNKFGDIPEFFSLKNKIESVSNGVNNLDSKKKYTQKDKQEKPFCVNLAKIRGNVVQNKNEGMFSSDFFTLVPKNLTVEKTKSKWMFFGFATKKEADNFLAYIKTKFVRFCLSILKNNSDIEAGEMALIPWFDFSKEWTDIQLRDYFSITKKEWAFIETVIPDYYD